MLLVFIAIVGAGYPILREAFPAAAHVICGLPTPDTAAQTRLALEGKLACAASLAVAVPWLARCCVGSWVVLTRMPAVRGALVAAAVVTVTMTAYDACTGFHSTQRTAEGCACWLTALLAGLAAVGVMLFVFAGRAIVAFLRLAITAIIEVVLRLRAGAPPPFARRAATGLVHAGGILLAYRFAGRGPPTVNAFLFA